MNAFLSCLTDEQLRQLSEDELSPSELEQLEQHLDHCDSCRRALEQAEPEPNWQLEFRQALTGHPEADGWPGSESISEEATHNECKSALNFVKLLGPTDDPRMLGRIGPYEIVGVLGCGGMGVVFKGFDAALNRYVAIKMLLPHLATSEAARKRFAREAKAAAAVVDDHVMAIHSVAEWQGSPYLVMPYVRGASLEKRLHNGGRLELREILRIGMQTAIALREAHAQGLVHRDVKPANILLGEGVERVILTDFGLARAVDDASLTRTGVLAGTPQYMSPEQARGDAVDERSDLFSLGSVMYAMCAGQPPFRASSSYGVLRLITDTEPQAIRHSNPTIPDWLSSIVKRLMAKQPADRFSSAGEVAALLESCLAHVQQPTQAALPPSLSRPLFEPVPRLHKIHLWGLLVVVASLATGLAAFLAWQSAQSQAVNRIALETQNLAGEWQLKHVETNGKPLLAGEDLKHAKIVFTENTGRADGFQDLLAKNFSYKLGPSKQTNEIDVTCLEGTRKGQTFAGVYALRNDELRICLRLSHPELGRPIGFFTKGGSTLTTFIFERTASRDSQAKNAASSPATVGAAELRRNTATCNVAGSLVSSEFAGADGSLERLIVSVLSTSDNRQIAHSNSERGAFSFDLVPGKYVLECTAVGSNGATFVLTRKPITVTHEDTKIDVGAIDLPTSKLTKLFGNPAPEFVGVAGWRNTDPVTLKQLRGNVVVLDFWAYYCTICLQHKPDLARLCERYQGQGLSVLTVHDSSVDSLEEMDAKMPVALKHKVEGLPLALDAKGKSGIFRTYGVNAVPTLILIDQAGNVVRRFHHAGDPELDRAVRQLLEKKP